MRPKINISLNQPQKKKKNSSTKLLTLRFKIALPEKIRTLVFTRFELKIIFYKRLESNNIIVVSLEEQCQNVTMCLVHFLYNRRTFSEVKNERHKNVLAIFTQANAIVFLFVFLIKKRVRVNAG